MLTRCKSQCGFNLVQNGATFLFQSTQGSSKWRPHSKPHAQPHSEHTPESRRRHRGIPVSWSPHPKKKKIKLEANLKEAPIPAKFVQAKKERDFSWRRNQRRTSNLLLIEVQIKIKELNLEWKKRRNAIRRRGLQIHIQLQLLRHHKIQKKTLYGRPNFSFSWSAKRGGFLPNLEVGGV